MPGYEYESVTARASAEVSPREAEVSPREMAAGRPRRRCPTKLSTAAAGVDVTWLEASVDAGFSQIRLREADSALGWLMSDPAALPGALDAMTLGEFEPEVWLPASAAAGRRHGIGLDELADMDVVHGPRAASPATYDAWLAALRVIRPRFEFADPPSRHSLPVALAFAATADRPTAVLTNPVRASRDAVTADEVTGNAFWLADTFGMVRVRLDQRPLTATAAVIWNSDLPRHVQQVLFDAAAVADHTLVG